MSVADALLTVEGVGIRFGGVISLEDVSFDVAAGSICGLIGPNGAGKTTLFNCITRLYQPQDGRITFAGTELLDVPAHRIAALGIGRTFQNVALIESLSVLENVMLGGYHRTRAGFFASAFASRASILEERALRSDAVEVLRLLGLESVADARPDALSYGTLKEVEFARALVMRPKLLLLDEPAAGLNHVEAAALAQTIRSLRERFDVTILLVEHHMKLVMGVCESIVVLDHGKKIAEGVPAAIQRDPAVIEAYLGAAHAA